MDGDPSRRVVAVLLALVTAGCLVGLAIGLPARVQNAAAAVGRAWQEDDAATVLRASGISAPLVAAIRTHLPEAHRPDGGRLVLYIPYGGGAYEMDANDPRGAMARQVRELWGRAKNLLYPFPRDVQFAREAGELLPRLDPAYAGRLLVLDGTQEPRDLAVGGRYTLVHEERLGVLRMRLWRWEGP